MRMEITCKKCTQTLRRSAVDLHVSSICLLSYGMGSMEESQKENRCTRKEALVLAGFPTKMCSIKESAKADNTMEPA